MSGITISQAFNSFVKSVHDTTGNTDPIAPDALLQDVMDSCSADSLDQVEIIMAMEENLEVEISDDQVESVFDNPEATVLDFIKAATGCEGTADDIQTAEEVAPANEG